MDIRLRVVPHFSSVIAKRAKHVSARENLTREKGEPSLSRRVSPFSRGTIFTRARVFRMLYYH